MRYRFPYIGADLRELVLQLGTSEHCMTTDKGSVSCDVSVYTPAFAGYSFQPTHKGRAQAELLGLGAWFCTEARYPSKDGHPPRH